MQSDKISLKMGVIVWNVLCVALFVSCAHGIRFNLDPNSQKCLRDEMQAHQLVLGDYEISEAPGQTIDYVVSLSYSKRTNYIFLKKLKSYSKYTIFIIYGVAATNFLYIHEPRASFAFCDYLIWKLKYCLFSRLEILKAIFCLKRNKSAKANSRFHQKLLIRLKFASYPEFLNVCFALITILCLLIVVFFPQIKEA